MIFLQKCQSSCLHGKCFSYVNNRNLTFCRCDSGWSGVACDKKYTCNCSSKSVCVSDSICLCPLERFGPRCYLLRSSCQSDSCLNGGTCVPGDQRHTFSHRNNLACICPEQYSGDRCEHQQTQIEIAFHDQLSIPQSLIIHFIVVRKGAEHIQTSIMKKIRFDQNSLSFYVSFTFNLIFVIIHNNYYLIFLQEQPINTTDISIKIIPSHRCLSIDELFNKTFAKKHLLKRIKYYHIPCQERSDLICFYDNTHICLCDHYRRANCFKFDHNTTYDCQGANLCENNGYCFQDYSKCPTSSLCVCVDCYYGSKCQYSIKGPSLSLDAILNYQIRSNLRITQQPTIIKVAIILSAIIFLFGFISNFLSFLTFRSKIVCQVGCGLYLFASSITAMITITVCVIKFWFLLASQTGSISNRRFIRIQCILVDFFLRVLLSSVDWLGGWVAIERAVSILIGIHFNKKKSKKIAKWVILMVFVLTSCTYIHDPTNRYLSYDEEEQRLWCFAKYSSTVEIFDSVISILHFFIPFIINCISACIIIIVTAHNLLVTQKTQSYIRFLHRQFQHHKHLLISPFILIILALPRLIISFLSGCKKSAREEHWLFLFGYFISFSPSMLTLIVFILPSNMYKKELIKVIKRWSQT
ncbi:unnamed protein product [Adineta ricciae]|uniref:EGF-like domain-containing protein n=2 Tax=Adineta ricciae TaxID=249248 RepID=A0A815JT50_ADIRI|nr:unnamed protein product [Adineta ricciae]